MISTTTTVTIKSINKTYDQEGSLITFGIAEFNTRSREGIVIDEIPYRSKGASAVVITERGEGVYGTASGYIDLVVDNKGEYKEKIATLVIRNFVSSQPVSETVPANINSINMPETPDFAKELLEENFSSNDDNLSEQPPF